MYVNLKNILGAVVLGTGLYYSYCYFYPNDTVNSTDDTHSSGYKNE